MDTILRNQSTHKASNQLTAFKGIKENIELGKRAIKEVNSFHTHSSSKLDLFVLQHPNSPAVKRHSALLEKTRQIIADKIEALRSEFYSIFSITENKTPSQISTHLNGLVKKYKVANCNEKANQAKFYLMDNGKKADTIVIKVKDWWQYNNVGGRGKDIDEKTHVFTVLDMDANANLSNINTWGDNAVIVDAWNNFTAPVKEGLDKIKSIFKIDLTHEQISFEKINPEDHYTLK